MHDVNSSFGDTTFFLISIFSVLKELSFRVKIVTLHNVK